MVKKIKLLKNIRGDSLMNDETVERLKNIKERLDHMWRYL